MVSVPETWPLVMGYGPWVDEIWENYLANAIKYGGRSDPASPEAPHVEVGSTVQEDGQVRFWVRDNGPGILPQDHSRLFVPFSRLGQGSGAGHGLGLSIVQRIVERLGGAVGVESTVGQGSSFYFTLPRPPSHGPVSRS